MTERNKQDKNNFVHLFLGKVESDSKDKEAAEDFLNSEGVNVERLKSDGLARIKKKQLELQAKKTEEAMAGMTAASRQAEEWVDNLLKNTTFSLADLVQQEELTVAFSHLEELGAAEVREILIRHFTLKFMQKRL